LKQVKPFLQLGDFGSNNTGISGLPPSHRLDNEELSLVHPPSTPIDSREVPSAMEYISQP